MNTKEKAQLRAFLSQAFGIIDTVVKKTNSNRNNVLENMLHFLYDTEYKGIDSLYLVDNRKEKYSSGIEVFELFSENNIHFLGMGCYRIVFGWENKVVKVNWCSDENEMELNKWNRVKRTSRARFMLPILDHVTFSDDYGLVLITPLVETITENQRSRYDEMSIYFTGRGSSDKRLKEWNETIDNIETYEKCEMTRRMAAQYAFASVYFTDDHEGNWGIYNGNLVIIDGASFRPSFDGRSGLFRAFKKYMEKVS